MPKTLEDRLMEDIKEGKEVDAERAILIFSGVHDEEKIAEYKGKLEQIAKEWKIGRASCRERVCHRV